MSGYGEEAGLPVVLECMILGLISRSVSYPIFNFSMAPGRMFSTLEHRQ